PGPDSWARSLLPIHEARNSVMRAVIADDDRVMTAIVAKTLQAWEIEVSVAHDGRAAWEQIIARDSPALAIIDWMMPGLDGPELCRRIRQTPSAATTYLILLTSRDSRSD